MTLLTQLENLEPSFPCTQQNSDETLHMECGRLIHAAIISRRFLDKLLVNPVQSIEDGYCGEKFAFTREEKQRIKSIHASNLAEFSSQLLQAVETPVCLPTANHMAYVQ